MQVKNTKLMEMHAVIGMIANRDFGPGHGKFKWGLSKNQDRIAKAYEELDKFRQPKPDYADEWAKYQREREEVIQLYAATDENGKFLIDNSRNEYVLPQSKRAEYREAAKPVLEKFADVIERHNETLKEFSEILQEDVSDVQIHKINVELIPDEVRSSEMTALMPLWYDPEDEEDDGKVVDMSKKTAKKTAKKKKAN